MQTVGFRECNFRVPANSGNLGQPSEQRDVDISGFSDRPFRTVGCDRIMMDHRGRLRPGKRA